MFFSPQCVPAELSMRQEKGLNLSDSGKKRPSVTRGTQTYIYVVSDASLRSYHLVFL
jgi:hypothetical protein